MLRFLRSALGVAAVALAGLSTLALATVPDPGQSTWDDLVGCSPMNMAVPSSAQYVFTGTIRDSNGVIIPNFPAHLVELDFSSCMRSSTRPADHIPADYCDLHCVWRNNLTFGGSDPCSIRVLVQNVVYKTLAADGSGLNPDGGLRSPDEDGNGQVALADLSVFQQEFVNVGVRHDYRGDLGPAFDGMTALADLTTYQQHFTAQ